MSFEIRRVRAGTTAVNQFPGDRLRIGRGTNVDLAFDDAAVDLEHAVLARDGPAWTLSDLDSVSGTWVNGRRIDTVRLAAGDLVEIGDHRIRVIGLGEVPVLEVLVIDETARRERRPGARPPEAEPVDYAAAHRLRQGWLSRASLSLIALVVALIGVLAVGATGRTTAFRPGPVSEAHARAIDARSCSECHRLFRGPADEKCTAACHESHSVHQATQVSPPSCARCHTEHRRLERLQHVPDAACVSCHRDLEVREGAERTFADRVTDFADDHPGLALTVSTATGETRRVPLSDAAARRSDPATLKLNHRKHMEPRLAGPGGKEDLTCESCHQAGGADGHLRPVEFEARCERCHQLGFDLARPTERAPHDQPERVRADLLAAFSRDPEIEELSLEERHRLILENPARARDLDLTPAILDQVNRAERFLYETRCSVCHEVDFSTSPPTVAATGVTLDWLPHARFPHDRHGGSLGLTCDHCHAGAEASTNTADVLLPGIEICRDCHGRGRTTLAAGEGLRVPSGCADCHGYHQEPSGRVPPQRTSAALQGASKRAGLPRSTSR